MSRQVAHFYQDKDEAVSRTLNWADDLNGSTISSVSWSISPSGLTTDASSNTNTTATIKLSGGTPGVTYKVEGLVTTAVSEKSQAHFLLTIGN